MGTTLMRRLTSAWTFATLRRLMNILKMQARLRDIVRHLANQRLDAVKAFL
jgi:hypothetical protein